MLGLSLNFGIWIKDAGWPPTCDTPDNGRVYPELVEGLRFRVRHWREIRRNQNNRILEPLKGFEGGSVLSSRPSFGLHFEVVVLKGLKGFYFFLTFSLDRNNIGCPSL